MKIGIEASRANKKEKTGTEWYAHSLIRSLTALDHEDDFFLYTNTPLEPSLAHLGPKVHERILRWPPKRLWNQLRLSMEMLVRKPSVLFLPAHTIPLIHPKATVTTLHDVGFDRAPELYARHELAYHRWAVRFALSHARRIIVPSAFTKREILELYPSAAARADDIVVIHHGFDASRYHPITDPTALHETLAKLKIQRPFYFYVGRLQEKKNTPRLVEAYGILIQRHPDFPVDLVLAGQKDFGFSRIEDLIRRYKLEQRVHLLGYIGGDALPQLIAGAVAFVFPSLYEGFGIPVLEAQACGTPVLTSTVASLPEVGGDGAFYVDPLNLEAIVAGLEALAMKNEQTQALREHGFQNLKRFSWEHCAQKTLTVLRSAVLAD